MEPKDNQRESILQFLRDFQTKNKLRFLFVCESGSRCHATSTHNSDHDLKGIYLAPTGNKDQTVYRTTNASWKGVKCKIDYEFVPFQKFLDEIVQGTYLRWATSTFTYVDLLQGALQMTIQHNFNFPVDDVTERISKDIAKAELEGNRQAKKLLNMVVDSLLMVQHKLTGGFPPMELGKLLEYLNTRQDVFTGTDEIGELAQQIIIMKKNGKGLTSIEVSPKAMELAKLALSLQRTQPLKTVDQMKTAAAALRKQFV